VPEVIIFEFAVRFEDTIVCLPEAALGFRGFDSFGGLGQSLRHMASAWLPLQKGLFAEWPHRHRTVLLPW
jgi:hypothetical protein